MKKNPFIAPVVISLFFIAYFVFYAYMCTVVEMPGPAKIVFVGIPIAMIFVMIKTLIERIKEIKKGETDDLSKY